VDRKIKKKKFTPKRISGVLLAGGLLAFGFYQFVLGDYSTKLNVPRERLTISMVRQGRFQEYIPVIGSVIPKKTIYLDAVEGGRVETRYIEAGTFVKKGQHLLTLANTDLLLDIMNREAEFFQLNNDPRNAQLVTGQHGEFAFDEKTYQITISKIYPEVTDGRFEIDMEFDGLQPEGITRGQTLHIRLELGNLYTAILLPQGGFYQKTGGQWVYLIDDTGEFAIKRKINLGRQNPEVFEVLAGLQPGEKVITSSYDNYGDNIDKLILK
jgi:HlyD family secretion protein